MNKNLLSDRSFDVFNVRGTTLLGIERSGSVGSQKLSEELCLLLRTGNCAGAIAIGNGTLAEAADLPIRGMLLAALSASAADDLFSNTTWRGIWLTEQMEPMITSEAMLDPAVSLGMLHLGTQFKAVGFVRCWDFSANSRIIEIKESSGPRITDRRETGQLLELERSSSLSRVSEHFQSDLERLKQRGLRNNQSGTAVRHNAVLGSRRIDMDCASYRCRQR